MRIDDDRFHRIIHTVVPEMPTLSADDATAIVQICDLVARVDLDDDADERATLDALAAELCAAAGITRDRVPAVSPVPLDGEERITWVKMLAGRLSSHHARELAYVAANLLAVSDLELAPVEQRLLDELRPALGIDEDRARELVASVSEIVTPGAGELPG